MRGLMLWELHRHGLRVNEYFLGSCYVLPAWHGACPGRQVRSMASKGRAVGACPGRPQLGEGM